MAYITKGQKADYELVQSRIDAFYPDFVECQLTFGIIFAHPPGEHPERPPLVRHGMPVTGEVKKSNYEDRVLNKKPDIVLKFDGPYWANLSEEDKAGEVDYWLYGLTVVRDKKSKAIKTDDAGRPQLRKRAHDKQVGMFDEITRRHGRRSPQSRAVEDLSLHYQSLLPPDGNQEEVIEEALDSEEAA